MPSIFSKIAAGEIPCYKIAETSRCLAFLDIAPLKKGHVLVIPKQETDHWTDLDTATWNELTAFSREVAKAIQQVIPCVRIGVVVAGFEVPHVHIHLIPVDEMQEMDFKNPKLELTREEFMEISGAIAKAVRQ